MNHAAVVAVVSQKLRGAPKDAEDEDMLDISKFNLQTKYARFEYDNLFLPFMDF